jgi:hypothetical protein
MVRAHQISAVDGKKLVIDPIQGYPDVGATVHVCKKISRVVNQDRVEILITVAKCKFLARSVGKLADFADEFSPGPSLPLDGIHC